MDQSSRKKVVASFVDIRKVHEKWSIFCFYGIFWIVVVFEIIALEILNLLQALRCNTQTFLVCVGSVFQVRECAQSILRMKLLLEIWFIGRNFKIFDFRFNTHIYFPESGSRKHFYASGMRAIDFSHKITPRNVIFLKNVEKFFSSGIQLQMSVPL